MPQEEIKYDDLGYPLIAPVINAMREVRDFMDLPHFITEHLPSPVSSNERAVRWTCRPRPRCAAR
jgi:hypothetical protein